MKIETWASIRHLYHAEKLPKKAIARKLGLDPKTVRQALKKETFCAPSPSHRASQLDPFKDNIQTLLGTYPGLSGVRIHEEIQAMGYSGGISILRDYLRTIQPPPKAFLPIRVLPAEEAQCDWAYAGRISSQKVYCFLMVLSFSGMLYLEFFPSQCFENFLIGHVHAFHYFGGVPKRIRYDNLSSVVLHRFDRSVHLNPRFLDFSAHYLFDPSPCNVKSPHEKGRVEKNVHYVKRNFLAGRSFLSLTDINAQALSWRDQTANCRIHGSTKQKPIDLFLREEQHRLIPLPQRDYDIRITTPVKSTSQALVQFETNRYSVPFAYASRMLTLKADDQFVSIYALDQRIAQHPRSFQKYQRIEDPSHYKGLLPSKPKATYFKHRDALLALGETARRYVEALAKTELHPFYQFKKVITLIDLYGRTEVLQAMDHALHYKAMGYEYLQNIILVNRRNRSCSTPPGSPSSKINPDLIRSTWVEERDPGLYDQHFQIEEDDDEDRIPETSTDDPSSEDNG
ncbi:MAG: IS21 family transposase [Candidatus Aminicenantes bacterium]|nr:IS21 family transposase [Candidatus Aminicenantes bacterium]